MLAIKSLQKEKQNKRYKYKSLPVSSDHRWWCYCPDWCSLNKNNLFLAPINGHFSRYLQSVLLGPTWTRERQLCTFHTMQILLNHFTTLKKLQLFEIQMNICHVWSSLTLQWHHDFRHFCWWIIVFLRLLPASFNFVVHKL